MCSKLSSGSWALLKLRDYVNLKTLITAYYSLVYSHLQYCITSWGSASAKTMDPLNDIHKHITRIMTKSSQLTHTSPLFHKLNILKIKRYSQFRNGKNNVQIPQ